jgi:hypothetical protein
MKINKINFSIYFLKKASANISYTRHEAFTKYFLYLVNLRGLFRKVVLSKFRRAISTLAAHADSSVIES